MPPYIDLTGQRFGRLVVLGKTGLRQHGSVVFKCRCDCGNTKEISGPHLRRGDTKSCGCRLTELFQKLSVERTTHGMSKTKTYTVWGTMLSRCLNKSSTGYYKYGGRGIKVCERWLKFENFLADMGKAPPGLSIDRIDNNGNYEPGNCRWATSAVQAANRRKKRLITFNDETLSLTEWGKRTGIGKLNIFNRLKLGWPIERALTEPVK